jgi:hypothetical protein
MSREAIHIPVLELPPQMKKDFAGARGRVNRAVEMSQQSVSFSEAEQQVRLFLKAASKSS